MLYTKRVRLGGWPATALAVAAASSVALAAPTPAAAADDPLAGLKSGCQVKQTPDRRPVRYRICAGKVASFDGTELDATLTLPPRVSSRRRLPLVVFLHGFLNSKGEYLSETRKGTGPDRGGEAYKTVRWNNVWFASRGYAVLNYSARGHGESGGEIGLSSKDMEVRDTQHLTGVLADDVGSRGSLVRLDPRRVGVVGGSYGGGQAWLLLTTRGPGASDYGSWRSPGRRLLRLAAVVPQYTWSDLLYALAPNGHHLESGVDPARADTPFGIGKETLLNGFVATAQGKLSAQVLTWLARFNTGEPYDDPNDPVVPEAKRALTRDRSGFYQDGYFAALRSGRQRRVPVLAAQGWTDGIFAPIESVRMYRRLRAASAGYPIQLYFGDFEHLTALVKIPDLLRYHVLGNRLFDRYLRRLGRGPRFDVESAVSNCEPGRFGPVVRAASWDALHPDSLEFDLGGPQQTTSQTNDPRGPATDPVLVSLQRGRGCIASTLATAPGVARYERTLERDFTLLGLPRLRLRYRAAAPDVELNSRLWDVAPDGTQTLVTRGAYRAVSPNPAGASADYELFGNAWRFRAGHRVLLEVTQDDSTYLRRDNFPSSVTIDDAHLSLPGRG